MINFFVESPDTAHCFSVDINADCVVVTETFRASPEHGDIVRCILPRSTWNKIAGDIALYLNRRAKDAGIKGKPARFPAKKGRAIVERLLGKELLVLLWAVEADDITDAEIWAALRNWSGLRPEEKWWLCTMTAAQLGRAEHRGIGWRGALRLMLCHDANALRHAA